MRLLVLGDLHLHAGPEGAGVSRDIAVLIDRYAGDASGPPRLVLAGDVYDLAVAGTGPLAGRLADIDARHAAFHDALARLCRSGGDVVLVPGNHDAEMLGEEGRSWVEARVPGARVSPWFFREGKLVHVEHGSQYDPDNAHPHPLVPAGDPLGVMLTRGILSRLGDLRLVPLSDRTPIPVLLRCFVNYGLRTPGMVARYVCLGLGAVVRGPKGHAGARATGARRVAEAARERGLDASGLSALARLSARPTSANRALLFRRLYLDRLLASAAIACVAVLVLAGAIPFAPSTLFVGAALLAGLAALLPNRYRGHRTERLRQAAHEVARTTGVRYVVFGHAHEPSDDGTYLNVGPFGMPARGAPRTYVEIAGGMAQSRQMMPGGDPPEPLPLPDVEPQAA
ncbi:MAG: metallophosphoesterase [Deltaproteobacteria bacterium]|nr:metallophosphoesterase [Deltaproteobacteria bacterium]